MAIGTVVGHSSRSFPVHREKVRVFYTLGKVNDVTAVANEAIASCSYTKIHPNNMGCDLSCFQHITTVEFFKHTKFSHGLGCRY